MLKIMLWVFALILVVSISVQLYKQYGGSSNDTSLQNLEDYQLTAKVVEAQSKRNSAPIEPTKDVGIYNGHIVQQIYRCFGSLCPSYGNYYIEYKDINNVADCQRAGGRTVYNQDPTPAYQGCAVR